MRGERWRLRFTTQRRCGPPRSKCTDYLGFLPQCPAPHLHHARRRLRVLRVLRREERLRDYQPRACAQLAALHACLPSTARVATALAAAAPQQRLRNALTWKA